MHRATPVIGLVGGIGAGKSTAAAQFAALGCEVIDADALGHALLDDPDVREEVRRRWGQRVFGPEGRVSRPALSEAVFGDPAELAVLNGILHPRMRREAARRIIAARQDPAVKGVVLDAAVLFEAGWDDLCTTTVFLEAPWEARLGRAKARRLTEEELIRREKVQIPLDRKRKICDYILQNSSTVSHLRERVRTLFHRMVHATESP